MNITAKELSGQHIGKTISVTVQDAFFRNEIHTGTLRAVTHEAETETIRGGGNHVLRTTVGQYVDLTIGNARINRISTGTPITIQDEQLIGQSGNTGAFAREPIQETIRKKIERYTQEGQ